MYLVSDSIKRIEDLLEIPSSHRGSDESIYNVLGRLQVIEETVYRSPGSPAPYLYGQPVSLTSLTSLTSLASPAASFVGQTLNDHPGPLTDKDMESPLKMQSFQPPPSVLQAISAGSSLSTKDFSNLVVSKLPIQENMDKIHKGDIMMSLKVDQSFLRAIGIKFDGGLQVGHTVLGVLTESGDFYSLGFYPHAVASPDPLLQRASPESVQIDEAIILNAEGVTKLKSTVTQESQRTDSTGRVWTKTQKKYNILTNNCLKFAQEFGLNHNQWTPLGDDFISRNATFGNIVTVGTGIALVAYLLSLAGEKKKNHELSENQEQTKKDVLYTLRTRVVY